MWRRKYRDEMMMEDGSCFASGGRRDRATDLDLALEYDLGEEGYNSLEDSSLNSCCIFPFLPTIHQVKRLHQRRRESRKFLPAHPLILLLPLISRRQMAVQEVCGGWEGALGRKRRRRARQRKEEMASELLLPERINNCVDKIYERLGEDSAFDFDSVVQASRDCHVVLLFAMPSFLRFVLPSHSLVFLIHRSCTTGRCLLRPREVIQSPSSPRRCSFSSLWTPKWTRRKNK